MSIDATTFQLPQTIPTVKAYNEEKLTKSVNEEMGQKEFLLLFTTQLQNQNPLDPHGERGLCCAAGSVLAA
jgi:Flagellar hook capping protein